MAIMSFNSGRFRSGDFHSHGSPISHFLALAVEKSRLLILEQKSIRTVPHGAPADTRDEFRTSEPYGTRNLHRFYYWYEYSK